MPETYSVDRARLATVLRDLNNWPASLKPLLDDAMRSAGGNPGKKPEPYEGVTPAQGRVLEAFEEEGERCTWQHVATKLGVHVGTVRRHVMDVKARNPEAYQRWCKVRAGQLSERHATAEKKRRRHSAIYFLKKNRRELGLPARWFH